MGHAVILPNIDFSNSGMGKVTIPTPPVVLVSLSIVAENSYSGSSTDSFNLSVTYNPANTTQTGVTWSIESGSSYASITSGGVLSILSGADSDEVVVKATSTVNSSIYATKTITVTYVAPVELTLLQTALADTDVAPMMSNYDIKYQLDSEITRTGSETTGIPVTQPITSLTDNYFVLLDVTFYENRQKATTECLFARLADNGNILRDLSDTTSVSGSYGTKWVFRGRWSHPTPGTYPEYVDLHIENGNRYKIFCSFNKTTGTLYAKNFTTGNTETTTGAQGNGTIRDEVYLYGGTVADNAFKGTIHDFIIGTL